MYKRGGHDKREQVPWTRLKRGTEWKRMRSSADDDDITGILHDAEEGTRLTYVMHNVINAEARKQTIHKF